MSKNIIKLSCISAGVMFFGIFFGASTVNAKPLNSFAALTAGKLSDEYAGTFSQNNITGWNPNECINKGGSGVGSDACFKIDSSVDAQDFWYPEGCLNNGTCTGGIYFEGSESKLVLVQQNPFLFGSGQFNSDIIKTDDDFGGMQYIYAENYDYEYNGAYTKLTPNGGNSTQKYYWIALPDEAYTGGFGDTYVATFENLSEPIYFIVFDAHACGDQSEDYCSRASADPGGVQIGKEFLGALTKNAGSPSAVASITGKLTSFCRINGSGEVTASADASNATSTTPASSSSGSGSTPSSTPVSVSGDKVTWIGDSYSVGAKSIIEEKLSGISFGGAAEASNSYIKSDKGVSDRYCSGSSSCSSNPPALTILQNVINSNDLKPYLVMAVGTNAGWTDDEVSKFKEIMASHTDTKVVFVTAKAKAHLMSDDNGTNERLKALVDSNDNYYLADWAAVYDDKYFVNNSTHPTANGGYEKWVSVIYDALTSTGSCTTYEGDYPEYIQSAEPWGSGDYGCKDRAGNPTPFGQCSCGPSSMAMLATVATGQDIFPNDVADLTRSTMYYWETGGSGMTDLDKIVGDKFGFEVVNVPTNDGDKNSVVALMKQYLNDGYMLHFSGAGSAPFTPGGHYVGAFSIDGDTVKIADSNLGNKEYNIYDVVNAGYHGGAFAAIKKGGGKNTCNNDICNDGDQASGTHSGGFTSLDEANELIVNPYVETAERGDPADLDKYHIPSTTQGRTYYNCFAFSNYFISKYTTIDFSYVSGDGGAYAENFYDAYHGQYPDLKLSTTPTPYSVAGCGDKVYSGPGSYSHTFIVLGVDESKGTMIYAEAGFGSTAVSANEVSLTDQSWGSRNGSTGICHFTDFSKYVTGL